MKNFNIVAFGTDSYKHTHWPLLPEGTEVVYSYCEPRAGAQFKETVFFGLQYIIQEYLCGPVVTREKIEEAASICKEHFGSDAVFNREGWEHILNTHNGHLPVLIKALPEGMVVPEGTALFTIENTDPQVPWLTNYLETLLMQVWSPITVASSGRAIKKIIAKYLELTGDPGGLPFKLHDFGYRGVSSLETAALAGAAHLVNFMGTDTMAAFPIVLDHYYADDVSGFSIPATEHSIMTAGGPENEANTVRQILNTYPTGLVAMVIDSYDTIGFIKNVIGGNEDILQAIREREGTVVFRPDSGRLPHIDVEVFEALAEVFGTTTNAKGYRVLPDQVRMIQGDGIKWYRPLDTVFVGSGSIPVELEPRHTVEDILAAFAAAGISADNIAFGSGGGLLQAFTRDTQRFAIKCSAMKINGEWHDIFKQPKTDPTKNSKRGRLAVMNKMSSGVLTVREDETPDDMNLLKTVFENGCTGQINFFNHVRKEAEL